MMQEQLRSQQSKSLKSNQSGQVLVEYVLLLIVAVSLATIIISGLVKRDSDDPDNSGAIIKRWQAIKEGIAKDTPQ